jgi:hypothetical protein
MGLYEENCTDGSRVGRRPAALAVVYSLLVPLSIVVR